MVHSEPPVSWVKWVLSKGKLPINLETKDMVEPNINGVLDKVSDTGELILERFAQIGILWNSLVQ